MPTSPLIRALDDGVRAVYLQGEPPLLLERALAQAEAWGLARCGLPAFNHARARASEANALDTVASARAAPMMGALRVVVLLDLDQAPAEVCEAVLDYLSDPSPTTLFIAVAGAFPKPRKGEKAWGQRLGKAFGAAGHVEKFSSRSLDRPRFAVAHASEHGLRLRPGQAALLVELVGDDIGRIAREVEKLAVYVGEGDVSDEDLRAVCSALAAEEVWELTAGLARRDPALALRALHRLLADAQEPHYLLAMVVMQLRKVLQAVQLVRAGANDRLISATVKMRASEVTEVRSLARSAAAPAVVLERLVRANRELNSMRAGSQRALEAVVLELCT